MKQKKLIVAGILLVLAAAGSFAQKVQEGTSAPDFELVLSTGKKVQLSAMKGKAVLLHFWATWCPPCRRELPGMDALAKKIDAKGKDSKIVFLGVCVSDEEKNRADFMKKNGYTFTGGLDQTGAVAGKYGVQGIPTSVLISPDGKIEKLQVGAMSESQLDDFVKKYAD